ncbi:MAG: GDSL-type esterase/lipase family protein [Bacteroidota bacterium]|nr:GDSL-type esterase/lipase family protein [Bacteroidota bacterium]
MYKKDKSKKGIKPPIIFYLILIIIPLLFFVLLEVGLELFGYGFDIREWVEVTEDKMVLNPDIARRYFYTTKNIPFSIQDIFDKVKKPGAFRVFILGESSAAGYPYMPVGSFSRYLQRRLEQLYPDCTIEVVNLSMTAINSYALRDIFPGVLEQQPDLVLIYSGHNEYYGALGIGSMESLGTSRTVVNLTLYLNKFKTIELLRNIIGSVSKAISSEEKGQKDGTLMSRIAKDQYIAFDSDVFQKGLEQYEGNMRDILKMARDYGVPVILGTLANNLKDQPPFISIDNGKYPSAYQVFEKAKEELKKRNLKAADSLFRSAKDLDALRFRSSEKMNQLIGKLGKEYGCPVVQIDSAINAVSPDGIVGDNLMTDHLHPTLEGYKLMGKLYFEEMKRMNFLPKCRPIQLNNKALDSLTELSFNFSRLDSIISGYRLIVLKNDWPFVEKSQKRELSELIKPKDFIEKVAFEFINDEINWEFAHRKVAGWYLAQKDYTSFKYQMDVLISQFPVIVEYYDFVSNELLKLEKYDEAYNYLLRRYNIKRDAYPSKWLGIIDLSKNRIETAIMYLEESLKFDRSDPQVLYNISGAYSFKQEYQKALEAIKKCLVMDHDFPNAVELRDQLQAIINRRDF